MNERLNNNVITDEILEMQVAKFHESLNSGISFKSSYGWVQKFKKRHGIRLLKICGEKLSSNTSDIPNFLDTFKSEVAKLDLNSEQIYNADETGLIYKSINDKTLVARNEKSANGCKKNKERITVMQCVNSSGTHKLPLMIIGKAKSPRCFKDEYALQIIKKCLANPAIIQRMVF